jgi:hypothetical protein
MLGGVAAQGHGSVGAEAGQQQLARGQARIAATACHRLVGGEVMMARDDLLQVLVLVDHGHVGHQDSPYALA